MQSLKICATALLAIAALTGAVAAGAQEDAAASPAAAAPRAEISGAATSAPPLPLLWKVSDDDNAIYLLGSFHLLKAGDYPVSQDIDAAFADAERVVFEVPPEEMADPALQRQFLAAAGYDQARTLSDVLSAKRMQQLDRLLAARGASAAQLEAFEPWFINLSLMLGMSRKQGFSPEWGLDQQLMQRAAQAGKPVGGLESINDQIRALDATPMDEQILGLADFLDRRDEMPDLLADLHQAWRSADIARLDALTRQEMQQKTPQTYRIINVERNKAWLPKLRAMLDGAGEDDALVVVGALHLLGDDGVVDMLRDRGYRVQRICSACQTM